MESLFLECAVRAALIAVFTAVILFTAGIKAAAARHTAWTSVLLIMLLLPLWSAFGPKAPIRLLPGNQRASTAAPSQNVVPHSVHLTEMRPVNAPAPPPPDRTWTWQALLLIVYALGAFALLTRLAIGTIRTHRLKSRANVRDGQGVSSECAGPVTVGWLRPAVILPKNWQEWSPQQLDAVMTHEREHIRRRDPLIQRLALVNRALFWFHPLSWWLERKLSGLAEEACDAAVLARGHSPQNYSKYLLDIARSVSRSGSRLSIVGMAMPGSLLRQRIPQILNSCGTRSTSRTRIVVVAGACAATSALFASATLEHARPQVQRAASSLSPSPVFQQAAAKPEDVVSLAAQLQQNPTMRLAQIPASPAAPSPQKAPTPPAAEPAQKERQLQDALLRSDPSTDMMIAMEVNYFQLNRAEYLVPLTVKIPGSELVLARNTGAVQTSFDFVGEIKDALGAVVQTTRDKVRIDLNGTAAQSPGAPIEYDATVTLLPGRYLVKFLARNDETGRMGSYESAFTVPNLNKVEQAIPISSVVLSNQRVGVTEPVDAASRMQAANPLIADGQRLIPSVSRIFSRSGEMYVYLQAYQREAGDTQRLLASAAFYQGQVKVWETAPIEVAQGADSRSRAVPLSLTIPLAGLKPGQYNCQVTVSSPVTQKTALWQTPIVIEP